MAQHSTMPGAARRRLAGAQSLATSTATELAIDDRHQLPFGDRLALGDLDLPDDAALGRQHGDFHLHRFEDHDLAFELDLVAGLELDFPDIARDLRLHVDDGQAIL